MTVFEITKTFRNGKVNHFVVVDCQATDTETLEDITEEWCEREPSGQAWGYNVSYNIITDRETIKNVLEKEIEKSYKEIDKDIVRKNKLTDYYMSLVQKD